ncbi:WXG100 family type VII secretion target [Streptomyces sp. NPDC058548]|uniref:WXG100 family type VII secretion target n=1 Tax=unclassified Streptomyces TaxID=2593676 RepID=UPI00366184AC
MTTPAQEPPKNTVGGAIGDGFQAGDVAGALAGIGEGGFAYNPEEIEAAANALTSGHQAVTELLGAMSTQVEAESVSWQGLSGDVFRAKKDEITTNLGVILDWVTQATQYLKNQATAVREQDQTDAGTFRNA